MNDAEDVVNKTAVILESGRPDANQLQDLRQSLRNLKLHELEVDVTSAKIPLQQELSMLRSAIENGGVGAAAANVTKNGATNQPPSAETQKLITSLESENSKLRDLLKEAQRELSMKSNNPPPAATPAANPQANAELVRYKQEVDMLKDQVREAAGYVISRSFVLINVWDWRTRLSN